MTCLNFTACLLLLSALIATTVSADQVDVWFGTTTPKHGLSKGIYHAIFDTGKGQLTTPQLAAEINSPGFLAIGPDGNTLYATGSQSGPPAVSAFKIEKRNGKSTLSLLNSQPIGDGGAAHVSIDRSGKILLSAQYGGGSTAIFRLADDGSIAQRADLLKHGEGSGVIKGRQDKPHAHWTGTSADNRFAFVPDLGMDKVVIWKLDADSASLSPHGYGVCPPGSGPRHMKFSPSGDHVYVLNELALSVTTFQYNKSAGTMTPIQTIPTLSQEVKAKETFNSASEIRVHPAGKFVYTANRGNDTITAFAVDQSSGKLSLIEVEPIRGSWPRNFNLDPTGRWLLAAGRDSNTIAVFEINQESGELTYTRHTVMVPTPICVLFGA